VVGVADGLAGELPVAVVQTTDKNLSIPKTVRMMSDRSESVAGLTVIAGGVSWKAWWSVEKGQVDGLLVGRLGVVFPLQRILTWQMMKAEGGQGVVFSTGNG